MPICIAGMHRSGTSMVANLLHSCGVYLGPDAELLPPAPDNPEGFWENVRFMRLNDEILTVLGGGWDFPPTVSGDWTLHPGLQSLRGEAFELIQAFAGHEPWGWKDPRNSITLPFWKALIPNLKVVVCLRNPLDVANSLRKRGFSSITFGTKLWLAYYQRLLSCLQASDHIITHYDAFFYKPQMELRRILDFLAVPASAERTETACSTAVFPSLQHSRKRIQDLLDSSIPNRSSLVLLYLKLCEEAGPFYLSILGNEQKNAFSSDLEFAKEGSTIIDSVSSLFDKDIVLEHLFGKLKEKEGEIRLLGAKLDEEIRSLNANVEEKERVIEEKERVIEEKERVIEEKERVIEEIHASRSWRITEPLRVVGFLARVFLKGFTAFVRKLALLLYRNLPLPMDKKARLKDSIFCRFGPFFEGTSEYGNWKEIQALSERRVTYGNIDTRPLNDLIDRLIVQFSGEPLAEPEVSIIIPVHNHIDFTVRCLLSIKEIQDKVTYEIILADDASNDETSSLIGKCGAIRYVRNKENLGFLRTCNQAAAMAHGRYIVLLNNDTIVQPGWLDNLVETFYDFPDAGVIGSKLIYPDGTLQEAGGIIWKNGDGWNFGRGDDPQKPEYNYLREVDYCTGASIIVPRTVWEQMGGFDTIYSPAYYEDTDLAFRVRKEGYRVLYQPISQVIHFEGTSSGTDISSGVKQNQAINRQKFLVRWQDVLKNHGIGGRANVSSYSNRYGGERVLYIDATTPTPDQDSGSIDAYQYLRTLKQFGLDVTFIPASNMAYFGRYTDALQKVGIECQYHPFTRSVYEYIRSEGDRFALVVLSRLPVAIQYIDEIRKHMPHAKILFNTVDLHFLREERAARLKGTEEDLLHAQKTRETELHVMREADHTILVSESELNLIHDLAPDIRASVIPLPREVPGRSGGFENRRDIVFIGGYRHPPNIDAVHYFVNKIWPLVSTRLSNARLVIAGSNMPTDFAQLASENIILRGYVKDLGSFFNTARLSIAPLRFGAGVKGKVVTSLSFGVPCVASSLATEGMGMIPGKHVLQADSEEDFADAIIRLYTSSELWYRLSDNGLALVQESYSVDFVKRKLGDLLKDLEIPFRFNPEIQ